MSDLIRALALETGLSKTDTRLILSTAPRRYKSYTIPKKSGGTREIAQPSREVKLLQRAFVDLYLSQIPVHPSATAYKKGTSQFINAHKHSGHTPILKLDFKEFFPSIHFVDWVRFCRNKKYLESEEDIFLTGQLLFRRKKNEKTLKLSIGAPSSPILCNILMYDFDLLVSNAAEKRGIRYTRYADDMTFSGQKFGMLKDMPKIVEKSIKDSGAPRVKLNKEKTAFISTKYSRRVTGLILANDGNIGIGRENRRETRAAIHHLLNGRLDRKQARALAGYLAYVNSVEPRFIESLSAYYGVDVLARAAGSHED